MTTAASTLRRWKADPVSFVREVFGAEPDAWQIDVLRAFPGAPRMAMKAPLCLDSIVPTPSGPRRWGDLARGDSLFAEDGTPTSIMERHDVGSVPLFRVAFRDGTSLRVSSDHEWDVMTPYDRKRGLRRTMTTAQLAGTKLHRGPQRLISIPPQGAAQYPSADLPADPYVFGLWLGDGIACEPRLIAPDHAIRRAVMARGQAITESEKVTKRIGLPGFLKNLRNTGMSSCRSYEKRIPAEYMHASVDQRLALLRGIMDSDGTCAKNGHTYLATSSPKLASDFALLARSLGYFSGIMGPYKINGGKNRDSLRVTITGTICPFLAETSKLARWSPTRKGMATRFIDSVTPDGFGPAMCVEIAHPSHCFQATDHIVTHNCKGPGKSCVLAWLVWNFLVTRLHPKVVCTSITGDNLSDGLWTELANWQGRSALLTAGFQWTKTRIVNRDHPETWWCSARQWAKGADPKTQGETLAGIHADNVMFVLDEAGGIPDAVASAAEAGLANVVDPAKQEAHLLIAGNPYALDGPLYRACTSERHLWHLTEITADPDDPKRTPRVSVGWARQQIEKYGKDNPWVLVNVYGRFPPSSLNALLGPDEVNACLGRHLDDRATAGAARILGVDVAREGDDRTVLFPRCGPVAYDPVILRGANNIAVADRVQMAFRNWRPQAIFVDATGGYGGGVVDLLQQAGLPVVGVQFAGSPGDARYANKRSEMWFLMAEWVRRGAALPQIGELTKELTSPTYYFKGDRFALEPKEQIKARLGYSPDLGDGLALTFAQPVAPPGDLVHTVPTQAVRDYDPFRS